MKVLALFIRQGGGFLLCSILMVSLRRSVYQKHDEGTEVHLRLEYVYKCNSVYA